PSPHARSTSWSCRRRDASAIISTEAVLAPIQPPATSSVVTSRSRLAGGRTAQRMPADDGEDLGAGAQRADKGAGNLRRADAGAIAHRHLDVRQTGLRGLYLHLDRPAEVAVAHSQPLERFAANGAERPEVAVPGTPDQPDEPRRQPIAEPLLHRQRSRIRVGERARADDEAGLSGDDRIDELVHVLGVVRVVASEELADVARRQRGEVGQACGAIARA